MSQWDKLIAKIRNLSKDIAFDELKKVLETYGYVHKYPSGGSSHCTFRKKGKKIITIPVHKKIKPAYIEMVRDVIEEEEEKCKN